MWEISNNTQITSFFVSMLFGAIYCVGYDVLRALRRAGINGVVAVAVQDVLFSLITAVISFLLMLVFACGEIRFYILSALLLGFLIFNYTLSPFLISVLSYAFCKLFTLKRRIFSSIYRLLDRFYRKTLKICDIMGNYFKKMGKKFKKNLKDMS